MEKKKVVRRVVNVLIGIIAVIILLITLNIIISGQKGYVDFFGNAAMAVESNSMAGKSKESFNKGDIIFVKILKGDEKKSLKVGQVVTFKTTINGKAKYNTHRIENVLPGMLNDGTINYRTKGDANINSDEIISSEQIVGVYSGSKIEAVGHFTLFVNSPDGFLVCVVIPAFLLVAYFVYAVISAYKEKSNEKLHLVKEQMYNEIMEKIKHENQEKK